MELEEFISGYCRALDGSRTVMLEGTKEDFFADCSFGNCPYESACPIAERIRQLLKDA